jgi:hypothetical protein
LNRNEALRGTGSGGTGGLAALSRIDGRDGLRGGDGTVSSLHEARS